MARFTIAMRRATNCEPVPADDSAATPRHGTTTNNDIQNRQIWHSVKHDESSNITIATVAEMRASPFRDSLYVTIFKK
jgi:hypothetical protein